MERIIGDHCKDSNWLSLNFLYQYYPWYLEDDGLQFILYLGHLPVYFNYYFSAEVYYIKIENKLEGLKIIQAKKKTTLLLYRSDYLVFSVEIINGQNTLWGHYQRGMKNDFWYRFKNGRKEKLYYENGLSVGYWVPA